MERAKVYKNLFSDRYSAILGDSDFSANFTKEIRMAIYATLYDFDAPYGHQPSRYDNWVENSSISYEAFISWYVKHGFPHDTFKEAQEKSTQIPPNIENWFSDTPFDRQ